MENTFELKFEMPYIECGNFKEKEILTILNIVNGSRVGQKIGFSGYFNVSFNEEDKQHWKPIFTYLDNFSRSKTNAFCFNISDFDKYDKIFVYYNGIRDSLYYGLLFYNSNTGKSVHLYNLDYDYTNLIVNISRVIKV